MNDLEKYKKVNQHIIDKYNQNQDSNDLLSIKSFIDNIDDGYIKNKKDAQKEFRTIKEKVKNRELEESIIRYLKYVIFGNNDSNGESSKLINI